ncbi:MAG: hypothetical protein HN353_11120 [Bdellovibrionales bacterium]|jgi:hypothetical protein|nr:hypothetical protein [Bdellovibrionales bacterium]MBT3525180.1 hypothetical protein [Bdellovibrionales bacterium]
MKLGTKVNLIILFVALLTMYTPSYAGTSGSQEQFFAHQFCSRPDYASRDSELERSSKLQKDILKKCVEKFKRSSPRNYKSRISSWISKITKQRRRYSTHSSNDGTAHIEQLTVRRLANLELGRELCPTYAVEVSYLQNEVSKISFGTFWLDVLNSKEGLETLADVMFDSVFKWLDSELESKGDAIIIDPKTDKVARDTPFLKAMGLGSTTLFALFKSKKKNVASFIADLVDEPETRSEREERARQVNQMINVVRDLKLNQNSERKGKYHQYGKRLFRQMFVATVDRDDEYDGQMSKVESDVFNMSSELAKDLADEYIKKFAKQTGDLVSHWPDKTEIGSVVSYLLGSSTNSPDQSIDREFNFFPNSTVNGKHLRGNLKSCISCALSLSAFAQCYQQAGNKIELEMYKWGADRLKISNQQLEDGKGAFRSYLLAGLPQRSNDPVAKQYQQQLRNLKKRVGDKVRKLVLNLPDSIQLGKLDDMIDQEVIDSSEYRMLAAKYSITEATRDGARDIFSKLYQAVGHSQEELSALSSAERALYLQKFQKIKDLEERMLNQKVPDAFAKIFAAKKFADKDQQFITEYLLDNHKNLVKELLGTVPAELKDPQTAKLISELSDVMAIKVAKSLKIDPANHQQYEQLKAHLRYNSQFATGEIIEAVERIQQGDGEVFTSTRDELQLAARNIVLSYSDEKSAGPLQLSQLAAQALRGHLEVVPIVDQAALASPEYARLEQSLVRSLTSFIDRSREEIKSSPSSVKNYLGTMEQRVVRYLNEEFFLDPEVKADAKQFFGVVIQNNIVEKLHLLFDQKEVDKLRSKLRQTPPLTAEQKQNLLSDYLASKRSTHPNEVTLIHSLESNLLQVVDEFMQKKRSETFTDLMDEIQREIADSMMKAGVKIGQDFEQMGRQGLSEIRSNIESKFKVKRLKTKQALGEYLEKMSLVLFDQNSGFSSELSKRVENRRAKQNGRVTIAELEQEVVAVISSKMFTADQKEPLSKLLHSYLEEKIEKIENSLFLLFKIDSNDSIPDVQKKAEAIMKIHSYFIGLKRNISSAIDENLDQILASAAGTESFDALFFKIDDSIRQGVYDFLDPSKYHWNDIAQTILNFYGEKFKVAFGLNQEDQIAIDQVITRLVEDLPRKFLNDFRVGVKSGSSLVDLGDDISRELGLAFKKNILEDRQLHKSVNSSLRIVFDKLIGTKTDEDSPLWKENIFALKKSMLQGVGDLFSDLRDVDLQREEAIHLHLDKVDTLAKESYRNQQLVSKLLDLKKMVEAKESKKKIREMTDDIRYLMANETEVDRAEIEGMLSGLWENYSGLKLSTDEVATAVEKRTLELINEQFSCGKNKELIASALYSAIYNDKMHVKFSDYLKANPIACPPIKRRESQNVSCQRGSETPGMKSFSDVMGRSLHLLGAKKSENISSYIGRVNGGDGVGLVKNLWQEMQNLLRYQVFCNKPDYAKDFCTEQSGEKVAALSCLGEEEIKQNFRAPMTKAILFLRDLASLESEKYGKSCQKLAHKYLSPAKTDEIFKKVQDVARNRDVSVLSNPGIFLAEMLKDSEAQTPSLADCTIISQSIRLANEFPSDEEIEKQVGANNAKVAKRVKQFLSPDGIDQLLSTEIAQKARQKLEAATYDFLLNLSEDGAQVKFKQKTMEVVSNDILALTFKDKDAQEEFMLGLSRSSVRDAFKEIVPYHLGSSMFYSFVVPVDDIVDNVLDSKSLDLTELDIKRMRTLAPECFDKLSKESTAPLFLVTNMSIGQVVSSADKQLEADKKSAEETIRINDSLRVSQMYSRCGMSFFHDNDISFKPEVEQGIVDTATALHQAVNSMLFLLESVETYTNAGNVSGKMSMPIAYDAAAGVERRLRLDMENENLNNMMVAIGSMMGEEDEKSTPEQERAKSLTEKLSSPSAEKNEGLGVAGWYNAFMNWQDFTTKAYKNNNEILGPLVENIGMINQWVNKYKRRSLLLRDAIRFSGNIRVKNLERKRVNFINKLEESYKDRFEDKVCSGWFSSCQLLGHKPAKMYANKIFKELLSKVGKPTNWKGLKADLRYNFLKLSCRGDTACEDERSSEADDFAKDEVNAFRQNQEMIEDFYYIEKCLACKDGECSV